MAKCAVCGKRAAQRHHLIKKQRIIREWHTARADHRRGGPEAWRLSPALNDERNIIPVCLACHKEDVPMPLPDGFWNFVEERNFWRLLPRHLMGLAPDTPPEAA